MKLGIKTEDNAVILEVLETELTSAKAPELKTELLRVVSEEKVNILVNLKSVSYIDSSGLSALLFGRRQVEPVGGVLKLCCLSDSVMGMIKIAQLDRVFNIYDTEEEALGSFQ